MMTCVGESSAKYASSIPLAIYSNISIQEKMFFNDEKSYR